MSFLSNETFEDEAEEELLEENEPGESGEGGRSALRMVLRRLCWEAECRLEVREVERLSRDMIKDGSEADKSG